MSVNNSSSFGTLAHRETYSNVEPGSPEGEERCPLGWRKIIRPHGLTGTVRPGTAELGETGGDRERDDRDDELQG